MKISIIVAVAKNGVIGSDNALLWHISEDLQRFKRITMGYPVVMGRKTFESLGRPLPGRENVVITRNSDYTAEGATVVGSVEQAIDCLKGRTDEVFIIGGAEIYRQMMPLSDRLYLTVVHHDYEGDTSFPEWDQSEWKEQSREYHDRGVKYPHPYEFINYRREKG